jgi:tetratricopeptide (TPR) repeat protein
MRKLWIASAAILVLGACDIPRFTADSTAKVLIRAQPSLQMESDYELASKAMPGTLKTIEGFWVVTPNNPTLTGMLTEGYCQYGTGFVEDEEEVAAAAKNYERVAELDEHATKVFIRCMNYALKTLGKAYQEDLFGSEEQVTARLAKAGKGQRTPLMWAAVGLASAINHNKDRVEMVGLLETAKAMLRRVIEIDEKYGEPRDKVHAALPHIALGMALTGLSQALGGDPDAAEKEFQKAIELTDKKFLLAYVLEARWVQFRKNDKKAFHDTLVKVLETAPSIWPEQRLANEIAQRRARRYLKQEQEIFP